MDTPSPRVYIDVDAKREGVVILLPSAEDAAAGGAGEGQGEGSSRGSAAFVVRQESLSPVISPAEAGIGATQRAQQWRSGAATGGKTRGGWGEGSSRW